MQVLSEKNLKAEARIKMLEDRHHKSKILRDDEVDMVFKWVSEGKVVSRLNLLYRASAHGFESSTFHEKCHGHGPLICFARSENNKRFGGYLHLNF